MRLILSIILMFTMQGLVSYNSCAFGFTPLLPEQPTVTAALQNLNRSYLGPKDTAFEVEGLGGHLGMAASVTPNVSVNLGLGHLAHSRFHGPMDLEGSYGHQVHVGLDVGGQILRDFYVLGLVRYNQENWKFSSDFIMDRPLTVELDSKVVTGGVGVRYRIPKINFYGRVERVILEENEGQARFTVLGSEFEYERDKKLYVNAGVGLELSRKVGLRFEKYWVGDESWTVALDVSL